ncbi:MAG: nitrilase-related carbon-nitrogen hydrolase [Candidatus Binatia bacterium]
MSNKDESVRRPAKGPRIGLAQLSPTLGDVAANMERHRGAIAKAAADGCDLLVFPELSLTGYRLKDSVPDVAIKRDSDTFKELEKLSEEVAFVIGLVEETPDHLFYNAAAYFEGGRCVALHRKAYLPTYGMFDEQRYFARGRGIAAFDTKCGRVALLVCEDMLHPSALTVAACDGATLIVVPSASPARGVTTEGEADANARSWESYLQVMARSFGVWVAYSNRVGVEDGVSFWGGSELVSPAGERVVKAAYYDEDTVHGVMSDDAVRRRRIVNPLVRDEDLDLTINELSRIRGRAVEKAAQQDKPARAAAADKAARSSDRDFDQPRAPRARDGEAPPRRFDRDSPPPRFDRDGPPRRADDRDARRDDDREKRPGGPGFRPKGPYEQRGGYSRPRDDSRDDKPRRFDGGDDRDKRPGGPGFRPKGPYEQRGGFSRPRDDSRDDKPRFGDAPRGRFGGAPRDRDDAPRGRFGGPPRGRDDGPRTGGFGPPRGTGGGFGGPSRGGGFGPPRGPMGAARERDDRGGGSFGGGKPRFGDGPARPRERERPEPRKPFHKGVPKPRGRGRKDD